MSYINFCASQPKVVGSLEDSQTYCMYGKIKSRISLDFAPVFPFSPIDVSVFFSSTTDYKNRNKLKMQTLVVQVFVSSLQ